MHDPVATKGRAKLGSGQGVGARQMPRQLCTTSPPPSAPSRAPSSRAATPCRTASPTRSNPATARRGLADPEQVDTTPGQQRFKPVRKIWRHRHGPSRRAARPASPAARSTISRRGVNHKPRPGSRSSISGTTVPSGPITKRSSRARSHLPGGDATALWRRGSLRRPFAAPQLQHPPRHVPRKTPSPLLLRRRGRAPGSVSPPASSNRWARSRASRVR